jgi:hypothetical protein
MVWVREVWPPALGPPDDDVYDLDPGWGRPMSASRPWSRR